MFSAQEWRHSHSPVATHEDERISSMNLIHIYIRAVLKFVQTPGARNLNQAKNQPRETYIWNSYSIRIRAEQYSVKSMTNYQRAMQM